MPKHDTIVIQEIYGNNNQLGRIGELYAFKIGIKHMHYTQLETVKPCYLYAD